MSDRYPNDTFTRPAEVAGQCPPLPPWLADRLLKGDEQVSWVVGPYFNPPWERYVTHPLLFLAALAVGVACVTVGGLTGGTEGAVVAGLVGGAVVLASVFVLGFASGYFTRLVVTSARLLILQGYEVVRIWGLDDLPYSLVRYRRRADGAESRAVDLDTLKSMFGGASDKFAESKTILAFGKQLDQITAREKRRP
jgi:hypothetical protein